MVDEGPLALDLDHRQPRAIGRLERRVGADVDLFQVEAQLVAQGRDRRSGALAEMAALGVEDGDGGAAPPYG